MFELKTSRSGAPTLLFNGAYLHSAYDPVREATEAVDRLEWIPSQPIIVMGFGLGYMVEQLLRKATEKGCKPNIHVIEWNPEVLGLAREARDIAGILNSVTLLSVDSRESLDRLDSLREAFAQRAVIFSPPGLAKGRTDLYNMIMETLNRLRMHSRLRRVGLKIAVVSPIYGGSLSTSYYVAEAFRSLGHKVDLFDFAPYEHVLAQVDTVTSVPGHRNQLHNSLCLFLSDLFLARCAEWKPDLVFALAQSPLAPSVFTKLREMKIPSAFWFVEDFRLFPYWKTIAPACDYFFTIQKGAFFEELRSATQHRFGYLPQACAPSLHRPLDLSEEDRARYGSDVSFMGAGYYNRRQFLMGLMQYDFKVWGTGWDANSILFRHVQENARWLSPEDVVRIYNASDININLHSSTYHDGVNPNGDFVNPRTFEIAAIGAFQITDRRELLPDLFEEGKEIVCFSTLDEAREKVDHYLKHPEERRVIAAAAQARALRDHSFEKRMQQALEMILSWDYPRFAHRLEGQTPVERLLEQARGDAELTAFLRRYEDRSEIGFQDIVRDIQNKGGNLDDTEMVFLLLDQLWQERVQRPAS
ncbi:MAG: glycosyltransferase [Nitrospirae bacterium]|nr:glycosyltransferase [Nitrospirota bacterium]